MTELGQGVGVRAHYPIKQNKTKTGKTAIVNQQFVSLINQVEPIKTFPPPCIYIPLCTDKTNLFLNNVAANLNRVEDISPPYLSNVLFDFIIFRSKASL